MKIIIFTYAVFFSLSLVASEKRLSITGSSTIAPLIMELGKAYEAKHPGVKIEVQMGGSSRGVTDVMNSAADIGMVSRALNENEKNLSGFTIAKDGVSIILNRKNKIAELTNEQIIKIYKGEIKNWKEVGGQDAPITVVSKAEGRSTLELFLHYFNLKNSELKPHIIIGDNNQGIKTVAGNELSIGYVSIGSAEGAIHEKTPIKLLPINKIVASTENVLKEVFPVSRPLNLVTKNIPIGLAKSFIDFVLSREAKPYIVEQYFVPLK